MPISNHESKQSDGQETGEFNAQRFPPCSSHKRKQMVVSNESFFLPDFK
jgi:hypothetical protein